MYAIGLNRFDKFNAEAINALYAEKQYKSQKCDFVVIFGKFGHGFSGSPVYTGKGKIAGIIQSGFDGYYESYFKEKLVSGKITEETYNAIKNSYNLDNGSRVGNFIPIKYLLQDILSSQ
jgi:hypothetical protein